MKFSNPLTGRALAIGLLVSSPGTLGTAFHGQSVSGWPDLNMIDSTELVAREAARVTLLALVASLPTGDRVNPDRVVVLPAQRVLSNDSAAAIIASLPKPIECVAEARKDVLFVTCSTISHPDRQFLIETQNRLIDDGEGPVGAVLREHQPAGDGSRGVLLLGRGDSLRVSFSSLEYWWRNHLIGMPLLMGNRDPNESERGSGAAAVIVLERGEDLDRT